MRSTIQPCAALSLAAVVQQLAAVVQALLGSRHTQFAFRVHERARTVDSRHFTGRRKSVASDELTLQPNYNKVFLKWRLSSMPERGKY